MAIKKTIQDIKIPERKTARPAAEPVAVPSKRKLVSRIRESESKPAAPKKYTPTKPRVRVISRTPAIERMPSSRMNVGTPRKNYWWLVVLLAVLTFAAIMYSSFFSSATVVIHPKEALGAQSQSTVVLAREPKQNEIPLVVMSLNDTIVDTVRSTGSSEVAERASGMITVYNSFSTAPQKLVEETRFESADGKIYKTAKGSETVIPGMVGTTPGKVEVMIYAAEAGAEYNQALTDFVIPGFRGTSKFDKFYARSTAPIAGGFVGTRATISPEDQARIVADLSQKLGDRLRAEAFLQKTDEFIILDQSARVEIGEPQIVSSTENSLEAKITIPGTYSALLLSKDELARTLAQTMVPGYAGEQIAIENIDSFQFLIDEIGPLQSADRLTVSIAGTSQFVYGIDEDVLKKQLLTLSRKESNLVFAKYPAIQSARLILRPFWKFRLPSTDGDIMIRYDLDGK